MRTNLCRANGPFLNIQDDKVELRPLPQSGIDDEGLKQAIRAAIARKPERHEFREQPQKIVRFMSRTGG